MTPDCAAKLIVPPCSDGRTSRTAIAIHARASRFDVNTALRDSCVAHTMPVTTQPDHQQAPVGTAKGHPTGRAVDCRRLQTLSIAYRQDYCGLPVPCARLRCTRCPVQRSRTVFFLAINLRAILVNVHASSRTIVRASRKAPRNTT